MMHHREGKQMIGGDDVWRILYNTPKDEGARLSQVGVCRGKSSCQNFKGVTNHQSVASGDSTKDGSRRASGDL